MTKKTYEKPKIIYNGKITIRACSWVNNPKNLPTVPGMPGCG